MLNLVEIVQLYALAIHGLDEALPRPRPHHVRIANRGQYGKIMTLFPLPQSHGASCVLCLCRDRRLQHSCPALQLSRMFMLDMMYQSAIRHI